MRHVGSGSLTRDSNLGPLHRECRVLVTGPPGKSQYAAFYGKRDFADRIRRCGAAGLDVGKGSMGQGTWAPLEASKGQEMDSFLEPPGEAEPCPHLS